MMNPQNRLRSLSRFGAVSLLSVALVVGVVAAPATAAPVLAASTAAAASSNATRVGLTLPPPLAYVALGDSFTSGQGAPPYSDADCRRSKYKSYPVISSVLSRYRLTANKACSGADVEAVRAQLDSLSASTKLSTKLVTLTVGGIDAGSNDILAACADYPDESGTPDCLSQVGVSQASIATTLPGELVALYSTIAADMPHARIAVMGYPMLFEQSEVPLVGFVNGGIGGLNSVIEWAAEQVPEQAGVDRVRYVDVTQEFAGHGIGSSVPYIAFNPANLASPANFHPNALGNTFGYYRALVNDGILRRP